MHWLDKIPLVFLVVAALVMGLAPFLPEPHLVEKLRMLSAGMLTRPIDIFDVLLHGLPAVVLILKIIRLRTRKTP